MSERTAILVKFPAETVTRIEAHAADQGLPNRMAAILSLLHWALDAWEAEEEETPIAKTVAQVTTPRSAIPVAPAPHQKPKLDTSMVPRVDLNQKRPAYQRTPAKPKGGFRK